MVEWKGRLLRFSQLLWFHEDHPILPCVRFRAYRATRGGRMPMWLHVLLLQAGKWDTWIESGKAWDYLFY